MSVSEVLTRPVVDRSTGKIAIQRIQDVEDIIEGNKDLQNIPQKSDWGRHIARIPNVILEKWFNEAYASGNVSLKFFSPEFDAIIARKLRDPEWAFLRVDNPSNPFHAGWRKQ